MNSPTVISPNKEVVDLMDKELIRLHNHLSTEYCDSIFRATILDMIRNLHTTLINSPVFVSSSSGVDEELPF